MSRLEENTMTLDELIDRLQNIRSGGLGNGSKVAIQIPYPDGLGYFYVPIINIIDSSHLITLIPDNQAAIHTFAGEAGDTPFTGVYPPETEEEDYVE